jgi:hypothetical protein
VRLRVGGHILRAIATAHGRAALISQTGEVHP